MISSKLVETCRFSGGKRTFRRPKRQRGLRSRSVADMLAKKGAEGDGASFAESVARGARETKEKKCAAIAYAAWYHEKIQIMRRIQEEAKTKGKMVLFRKN